MKKRANWEKRVSWTPELLKEWKDNNPGVTLSWLSQTCGRDIGYLSRSVEKRLIAPSVLKQLATLTDIPYTRYTEFNNEKVLAALAERDKKIEALDEKFESSRDENGVPKINESRVSWAEFHGANKKVDLDEYDWPEEEKERFAPKTYDDGLADGIVMARDVMIKDIVGDTDGEVKPVRSVPFVKLTKITRVMNADVSGDFAEKETVLYIRDDEILNIQELLKGSLVVTRSGDFIVKELPAEVIERLAG